ncbi:MAG: hypothetical protein LBI14_09530 [Treponema sp.]|nr:hypothetical protein [Treponema sp.]
MRSESIISIISISLVLFGILFFFLSNVGKKPGGLRTLKKGRFPLGGGQELPRTVYLLCLFASGIMLNWIGFSFLSEANSKAAWFYKLLVSFFGTLPFFVGQFTGANNHALARANKLYEIAIMVCLLGCFLFTALIAIRVFFQSIINNLRYRLAVKYGNEPLLIIAGNGPPLEMFLASLTPKQKGHTIIILDSTNEDMKKEYSARAFAVLAQRANRDALIKAGITAVKEAVLVSLLDDDERSLSVARAFADIAENVPKVTARIMYTGIDRAEHFSFIEKAHGQISFFNPYDIIGRQFLMRYPASRFLPSSYMDPCKAKLKGSYAINHIFIGFGKTNAQILRKSVIIEQLPGCNYNALVIDTCIENSQAAFRNAARGLFIDHSDDEIMYFPNPDEQYHIEFKQMNVLSKEFYELTANRITNSDFSTVIIALGNDRLNAETAMELRQWLYERGADTSKLRLYIKAKRRSSIINDETLNYGAQESGIAIQVFGIEDDIFSASMLINRDIDILAKHIAGHYSGVNIGWDQLTNQTRDSNRCAALSIRVKLNLMGFDLKYDLKENQKQDEGVLADFKSAYQGILRDNIARLEHQRWNTYHLASGWQPMPKNEVSAESRKNDRSRKHACITTFEGLEELAILQAQLKTQNINAHKREAEYKTAFAYFDTRLYDYDLMDNLLKNLEGTKFRIVRKMNREQ